MEHQVSHFRKLGADAVVIGCLKEDGSLDLERMKRLVDLAGDMEITLHRAFDVCRDPEKVLRFSFWAIVLYILYSIMYPNEFPMSEILLAMA